MVVEVAGGGVAVLGEGVPAGVDAAEAAKKFCLGEPMSILVTPVLVHKKEFLFLNSPERFLEISCRDLISLTFQQL
jgi:hypothetical protein